MGDMGDKDDKTIRTIHVITVSSQRPLHQTLGAGILFRLR